MENIVYKGHVGAAACARAACCAACPHRLGTWNPRQEAPALYREHSFPENLGKFPGISWDIVVSCCCSLLLFPVVVAKKRCRGSANFQKFPGYLMC